MPAAQDVLRSMHGMGDSTSEEIGRRLREARIRAGYGSAAAAARRFGWKETTYQQAENGTRPPSRDAAVDYAQKLKIPLSELLIGVNSGFRDEELRFIGPNEAGFEDLRAGLNQGRWQVRNRLLELEGYRPGDVVLADSTVEPTRGDVVVAQLYDELGGAETVLRIYRPPFLVTATADSSPAADPVAVDGEKVVIWGTVVKMLRTRE